MNSPRQLYKFLSQKKGDVADLVTQTKINQKLSKNLNNLLDPILVDHVSLATIRSQTLVLIAHSAAWASRARYFSPVLLQKVQNNSHIFGNITKIEIQLEPSVQGRTSPPATPRYISESAADCLQATAETVENEALKAALKRLAGRKDK